MTPPLDNPRKKRDMKFNRQIIRELTDLGIYDEISDFIHENPTLSIPEIQSHVANVYQYPDIGAAEIQFMRNGYYRPMQGNGRGANKGRRKQHKTIDETLEDEFEIEDINKK